MKRPSFQFYPQDWRSDPGLRACTREERSVWIDLLCIMHDSPRRGVLLLPSGEPMPIEEIARNIGETRTKTLHFLEKIAQRGVSSTEPETGALFSRRMVRDEYISQLRSSVGGLGGNPVLLTKSQANVQPKAKQTSNQKLTPSSSSSSSREGEYTLTTPTHSTTHQKSSLPYSVDFEIFWAAYPRKKGKGAAFTSWQKNGHPGVERIVEILELAKNSPDWLKDSGRFIPHPATWLNQKRWDDDYGPPATPERKVVY